MVREVDLGSYLPPFMAEFKELGVTLEAENPEFVLVWKATDRVLKNEFIESADEYGITRFEKLLGIHPAEDDTLESRRSRVSFRWFLKLPYTMQVLLQKLTILCGDTDFMLTHNFSVGYTLTLETDLELFGQVEELERVLGDIVPCNIIINTENKIASQTEGRFYLHGVVSFAQDFYITSKEWGQAEGKFYAHGGVSFTQDFYITSKERK